MIWLIFALLTAFFISLREVLSKKSLVKLDEYVVAYAWRLFALPFLLPLLFFIEIPSLNDQFWYALIIAGILNIITTIIYVKAIKCSDLSLSMPMLTFTPLFILITSPLIVNEFPGIYGLIGVLLIVAGSYVLNIKERRNGYIAPFKALIREKGPRLMLIVALIWSVGSNVDKVGVVNSSPVFWIVTIHIFLAIFMLPIVLYKSKKNLNLIPKNLKSILPIGALSAAGLTFQMMAINLTLVAYAISIKRTSVIVSVLFGYFLFKEKGIKERLTGVIIMVAGVLFITLSS